MQREARRMAAAGTLLLSMAAVALPGPAGAVPVTFQVRMAQQTALGAFDPSTDLVDLAGSFNGWGSPVEPLADGDGDTIWEITRDGFTAGQTIEFKFRINGQWDGSEEFPGGGPNRSYTVQPSANTILVWYNDLPPPAGTGELHWWNDTVFYEIFVRSFHDSDGDGIGDLAGLTQKLDYLNDGDPATTDDLGIGGIWLMPVASSPSYHGYDAVDYRAIEPDYGTLADFQAFLDAAHVRGIKVIVDLVLNHCSSQHPWFSASAANDPGYRSWFRWSATDPGGTGPWGQQVWHPNASGWYYGLFWGGMPDLNYDTPALKTEMLDTATYWLDTVGVDGFRLDAVLYIDEDGGQLQNTPGTLQFWQEFRTHMDTVKPDALAVGEAWTASSIVNQYVIDDRLDLCFEFDLAGATLGAVNGADAGWLATKAAQVYALYPFLQFGTFLTNHDQDRAYSVLGQDEGRARVAAGIYLTLPGVPFVYYGEEIGMTGTGAHENIRTPMQWSTAAGAGFTAGTPWYPVNTDYLARNVAVQEQDPGSLLEWYKRLIHLRGATPALRRGAHHALQSSRGSVLAFARIDGGQSVLCLANTSASPRSGITVTGAAASLPPGERALVNLLDPADVREITITADHRIQGLDLDGHEVAVYELRDSTGVIPGAARPGLRLEGANPNPFQPPAAIRYELPRRERVRIGVYDLGGREVRILRDEPQDAGVYDVPWDGTDRQGRPMSVGVYFVRLEAGGETRIAKITLLR